MRHAASILLQDIRGTADDAQPLHVRIGERLRRAIVAGGLAPRSRLPSARTLARDFGVSRQTVERALDQLRAEGFVCRRQGSGTYVAAELPERELPPVGRTVAILRPTGQPVLSRRGELFRDFKTPRDPLVGTTFTPTVPSLSWFPRTVWSRLVGRALRRPDAAPWIYGASEGLPELREAIAAHVSAARAATCSPEQVIVLTSAHQAIDLTVRLLLDVGESAWVEDPHYPPLSRLLMASGVRVVPVPVDDDGLDVVAAVEREPGARLACITPSHQYPGGGTMSLDRRRALLEWAERTSGWIIEDDHDGDLRYSGRPLASLQGLDRAGRVIYVGTFCKMMFPTLRIAFVVVPPALVDAFRAAKHLMDGHTAKHTQAALAEFIGEGHLAAHLRRSTAAYDERRVAVLDAFQQLEDVLELGPVDAGLHFTAYLREPLDDQRIAEAARAAGVRAPALSRYYLGVPRRGFVLGFACSPPCRSPHAARVLARVIDVERRRGRPVQ